MCLMVMSIGAVLIGCKKSDLNPQKHDGEEQLRLELILSAREYKADEPIECKAVLSYVGEGKTLEFYTGDPVVMFAIGGGQFFILPLSVLLMNGLHTKRLINREKAGLMV